MTTAADFPASCFCSAPTIWSLKLPWNNKAFSSLIEPTSTLWCWWGWTSLIKTYYAFPFFLLNACCIICDFFFHPLAVLPPQRDVIMMYHFPQIKALCFPSVNLNAWTLYFELIGCCRNPLNMSNLIRYSVTIVQFNLSHLIGFDCLFLVARHSVF